MRVTPRAIFGAVFGLIGLGILVLYMPELTLPMPEQVTGASLLLGIVGFFGLCAIFVALFQGVLFRSQHQ